MPELTYLQSEGYSLMPNKFANKFRRMMLLTGVVCLFSALSAEISMRHHFYPGVIVGGCIFILVPVVAFLKIIRDEDWRNRSVQDQLELGKINVANVYRWIGDPRFGSMTLYVDGHRVGKIPLNSTLGVPCVPNVPHTVRVRLRNHLSTRLNIMVEPKGSVQLEVDIEREGSVLIRMWHMLIHPLTCLSIKVVS